MQSHLAPGNAQAASSGAKFGSPRGDSRGTPLDNSEAMEQTTSFLQSGADHSLGDGKRPTHASDTLNFSASATHTVDGSFWRTADGITSLDMQASKLHVFPQLDASSTGANGPVVADNPSEVQAGATATNLFAAPGACEEHDTRPLGWGKRSSHSGTATPTSIPSARAPPAITDPTTIGGDASFGNHPFGKPADTLSCGQKVETRTFGRPVDGPVNNGTSSNQGDTSFETRAFGRPSNSAPNGSWQQDEAIAAIAGMEARTNAPQALPKRSLAPWSADGKLVATLRSSELDEDELQGSDSEAAEDTPYNPITLAGRGRLTNLPSRQPQKEVNKTVAQGIGNDGNSSASQPARTAIQPALNSFDFGIGADELSESEDILKASLDQPSEDGSGSIRTPTHRKNPLDRGTRGRGAGLRPGLPGGNNGIGLNAVHQATEPGMRTSHSAAGSSAGRGYISPAKGSSLSSLRPKAKAASRFNLSDALGGDIDWNQANNPW